jgi:hypothetical protein
MPYPPYILAVDSDGSKKQDIQKTSTKLYDFNRKRFNKKTLTSKFDVNLVVY